MVVSQSGMVEAGYRIGVQERPIHNIRGGAARMITYPDLRGTNPSKCTRVRVHKTMIQIKPDPETIPAHANQDDPQLTHVRVV